MRLPTVFLILAAAALVASLPAVREEVRRSLASGITEGRRFILREANNMPPGVALENLSAMYHAAREFGRYA